MPLLAKDSGGADFDPVPAGMQHAICYGVIDLGTQPSMNPQFKPKHQVCLTWELPTERYDFEKDGVKKNLPRAISSTFTLSLSPKGNLRPMLESWRGRQFTEEELKGFEMKNVLGANCLLNIIHEKKEAKVYANVQTVSPLMKGTSSRKAENPLLYWSLDEHPADLNFPPGLPEWLQKKIMGSMEVRARQSGGQRNQELTPIEAGNQGMPSGVAEDENAPF